MIQARHASPLLRRAVCFLALLAAPLQSQSITVQVLNAHNGRPIRKETLFLTLNPGDHQKALLLKTDAGGTAVFAADGAQTYEVVLYHYINCADLPPSKYSFLYSVSESLSSGVVTPNDCHGPLQKPVPGTLVLYVRRASWLDLFR